MLASSDNTELPQVVATDAIVTPFATEDLLSFLVTGQAIAYLREASGRPLGRGRDVLRRRERGPHRPT